MWRILILLPMVMLSPWAVGAAGDTDPAPEEIIDKFIARETEFHGVWQRYTYTQNIVFQVLNHFGQPTETREMKLEVYFTQDGERRTRVLRDRGMLRSVSVTREDLDDAVNLQPFVLTRQTRHLYRIEYLGRERVDELDTFVFAVEPVRIRRGERYFEGRIWVDDRDFQIVMTRGKAVPDSAHNKFPEFETVRQQVDGRYWFPVWTEADDVLTFGSFGNRRSVRIRQLITYENFQQFEVGTRIQFEGVLDEEESSQREGEPEDAPASRPADPPSDAPDGFLSARP